MDWKDVNLRFKDKLKRGDVVVCRMTGEYFYNQTDIVLCVYENGHFYDIQTKEDNIMPKCDWCLTNREVADGVFNNLIKDYSFTGENVEDIISPVLG